MPSLLTGLFRRARPPVADLTCYTRADCCLCDQARTALTRLAARGLVTVTYVDIDRVTSGYRVPFEDGDARLVERFGTRVPVVCRGDEVLAEGKVSEVWLARALTASRPPATGL